MRSKIPARTKDAARLIALIAVTVIVSFYLSRLELLALAGVLAGLFSIYKRFIRPRVGAAEDMMMNVRRWSNN